MITVENAIEAVQKNIQSTELKVSKNVLDTLNDVLFEDVFSPINMPPFRQSAMDGYAVNLHDNIEFTLIDKVKAGDHHIPLLEKGDAVRIFTGAAVPPTANAVIMQEKVIVNERNIIIDSIIPINNNIRPLGEQVKRGELALAKGTKLNSASIGYLSSLGVTEIFVYKKPNISILVTGDELINPGQQLSHGKIYESNGGMLKAALEGLGFSDIKIHRINDVYEDTKNILAKLIDNSEMIIVTGGISVGDYDYVGKVLKELQVQKIFYRVKQKPGKPLYFGTKGETAIFALPGNPAAALTCLYVYVNLALQLMIGNKHHSLIQTKAKSNIDYTKKGDRAQFLKAIYNNGQVTILEGQSSAMLHTFALSNALVYIPAEQYSFSINEEVNVIILPR